jgi:hypothetical protein
MRYHEVASGLRMVLHGEDQDLLNHAKDGVIAQEDLDERDREVARLLVSRGVLDQYKHNGAIFYHVSSAADIGRDPYDG